jgi:hypothetical protein
MRTVTAGEVVVFAGGVEVVAGRCKPGRAATRMRAPATRRAAARTRTCYQVGVQAIRGDEDMPPGGRAQGRPEVSPRSRGVCSSAAVLGVVKQAKDLVFGGGSRRAGHWAKTSWQYRLLGLGLTIVVVGCGGRGRPRRPRRSWLDDGHAQHQPGYMQIAAIVGRRQAKCAVRIAMRKKETAEPAAELALTKRRAMQRQGFP